jgi:hypothetical protein
MEVLLGSSATKVGEPGTVKVTAPTAEPVSPVAPPPPHPAKAPRLRRTRKETRAGEDLTDGMKAPEETALIVLITGEALVSVANL